MGQLLKKVLQMFGSLLQVEITPRMSTPLEETLQQLGRLQLEETLQQLGRLQLEETLRNQPQFLRAQPSQLQRDLQSRLQPLMVQLGLQGLILMLQQKQETQNLATKILSLPPLGPSQLEEIMPMERTSPLDN